MYLYVKQRGREMSHKHHNNNPFKNTDIDENIEEKQEKTEEKVEEKNSDENTELTALQDW